MKKLLHLGSKSAMALSITALQRLQQQFNPLKTQKQMVVEAVQNRSLIGSQKLFTFSHSSPCFGGSILSIFSSSPVDYLSCTQVLFLFWPARLTLNLYRQQGQDFRAHYRNDATAQKHLDHIETEVKPQRSVRALWQSAAASRQGCCADAGTTMQPGESVAAYSLTAVVADMSLPQIGTQNRVQTAYAHPAGLKASSKQLCSATESAAFSGSC